jgi:hypothetical protein
MLTFVLWPHGGIDLVLDPRAMPVVGQEMSIATTPIECGELGDIVKAALAYAEECAKDPPEEGPPF